jgi:hypothetical protein
VVRRLPHVVALTAIVLLSVPTAASAAYSARVEAPDNAIVTGAKEIQVRVSRDLTDSAVTDLRVRLASGGELQPTECVRDCDRRDRDPVFGFELDPRSGAPFGTSALANGPLEFEGIISREVGGDRSVGTLTVTLRVPGSAVGGLAATAEDGTVRLAWRRASEPDIQGYRIERCGGACDASGRWDALDTASASASSHSDQPDPGEYSYRVVTIRDGGDGGDRTIETVSSPVTTTVEPVARTNGDGSGNGNGNGNGGNGSGGADGDGVGDGTDPSPRTPPSPDPANGGSDGARRSSRAPEIRSGSAPSISRDRTTAGVPAVPDVADVFEEELDYSDLDLEEPGTDRTVPALDGDDEVILGAPGTGDGTFLGALTDPNRVAVPIAGGLLMTAIGLHLWRWLRFPLA